MQAALIVNGVVVDMVLANYAEMDDGRLWVDGTGGAIGDSWADGVFTPPPPPPAPAPDYRITRLAFRNRFLPAEKILIDLASLDNPAAPMNQRQQQAAVRVHLADVTASTFIDLARGDTRAGVQQMEGLGLLAEGRALQILDTPILPEERPL